MLFAKFNKTFVLNTKNVKFPDKFLHRDVNDGVPLEDPL